ncbi:MAG: ribosome recycling factor [Candidatus Portnoybacteria bacterium]|nr:ribosome recycling factor [Candidatus Portnoybacteria bacterium]
MPFHFSKDEVKKELEKNLEAFKEQLLRIHTGQVNPALIENVAVPYQGFEMKLKELAAIRREGVRTLVVEPWEKGSIGDIERALLSQKRVITPQVKGNLIYLNFPDLTSETRQGLIKEIKEIKEQVRVKIRRARDEWWEKIQLAERQGEIREDDKFRFKEELQKLVDEYNEKAEEITERKIKSLE